MIDIEIRHSGGGPPVLGNTIGEDDCTADGIKLIFHRNNTTVYY